MLFKTKHHFRAMEQRIVRQLTAANLEHFLTQSTLRTTEPGVAPHDPSDAYPELMVSLTTFAPRLPDVHKTIETLLQQTLRPARIVLWISHDDPEARREPRLLKMQTERGLEIRYCDEDLGPYKKLLYSLREFPHARIVTVDDDTLYPPDFLEQLDRAHREHSDVVHCHRAKLMTLTGPGTPRPYKQWATGPGGGPPGFRIFPTGVGGVLYFPGCFAEEVQDIAKIRQLCPNGDDIWFKAMTLKQGVKCRVVPSVQPFCDRFTTIGGSQRVALKRINKKAGSGNDEHIRATFGHFGLKVPAD